MPAGGFKTFVAGEILTAADTNDFLMQGVLVFAGTAARGSAITSPVEGQFAYLSDTNALTFYTGSAWEEYATGGLVTDFLVIAGGGAAGQGNGSDRFGAGGGAGGYITSAGTSGAASAALDKLGFFVGDSFTVTVGAGGSGASGGSQPTNGANSVFAQITALGGGKGGPSGGVGTSTGGTGGSGGGGGDGFGTAGSGTALQGRNGAAGGDRVGGGGGGANTAGSGSTNGAGLASDITGTSVTRAVGGNATSSVAGTANTGNGATGNNTTPGKNGGSGVVILKYPKVFTLSVGAGLTSSTTTSGSYKITTFTAGTDTVSF